MGSGWLRSYVLGITRLFKGFSKAIFARNFFKNLVIVIDCHAGKVYPELADFGQSGFRADGFNLPKKRPHSLTRSPTDSVLLMPYEIQV